ncbi:MAG: hypothetical protein MRY83_20120 [Flavobacteriales bacterium]|nr:hypothetical protein [Flavobacteriales bacterium]
MEKLTQKKLKAFCSLIKDEKSFNEDKVFTMLKEYPELINKRIEKIAKGINGYSSLRLAIRFYNYPAVNELIKLGADVNFIDDTPYRYYSTPIFFDFMEMFKQLVEWKNFEGADRFMKIWDLMDDHGLNYSIKSYETELMDAENYLDAAIRLIGAGYGQKHITFYNSDTNAIELSQKERDLEKEKWYVLALDRLIQSMNLDSIKEVNISNYRNARSFSFYSSYGVTDKFSVVKANELVKKRHNISLKNYSNEKEIERLYEVYKDYV